jgi:hypothetical protein
MRRKRTVFLVLHHEIMLRGQDCYFADEVVFYVASSLERAIQYIKRVSVEEYSWWEIEQLAVDSMDDPIRVGWYGRRGGRLKAAPFDKSLAAFKRCESDPNHHLNL